MTQFASLGQLLCQYLVFSSLELFHLLSLFQKFVTTLASVVVCSPVLFALGSSLSFSFAPPFHFLSFRSILDGNTNKHVFSLPCVTARPTPASPVLITNYSHSCYHSMYSKILPPAIPPNFLDYFSCLCLDAFLLQNSVFVVLSVGELRVCTKNIFSFLIYCSLIKSSVWPWKSSSISLLYPNSPSKDIGFPHLVPALTTLCPHRQRMW